MDSKGSRNATSQRYSYISEANEQTEDFFDSVNSFVSKNYGYSLKNWFSSSDIPEYDLYLYKNCVSRTFYLCVSSKLIEKLLDRENIVFDQQKFKLYVGQEFSNRSIQITCKEDFDKAILNLGILRDWEEEEAVMNSAKHSPKKNSSSGILNRIVRIFLR